VDTVCMQWRTRLTEGIIHNVDIMCRIHVPYL
jgi:hypothetical protein